MIWPQFTRAGISPEEFRRLYQCDVGPDPRLQELTLSSEIEISLSRV